MTSLCSEKWATFIRMTSSTYCALSFICATAHAAKCCLPSVSASNNSWTAWILYEYKPYIPRRIHRIDSFATPVFFAASRAQTLLVDVSADKSSMTLCTTWTRSALKASQPLRGWSSKFFVFSRRHRKLNISFNEIGGFCVFSPFSERNFRDVSVVDLPLL